VRAVLQKKQSSRSRGWLPRRMRSGF